MPSFFANRQIKSYWVSLLCLTSLLGAGTAWAEAYQVNTMYGAVTVKATPKRVVVLEDAALDTALAVGIKPVGTLATRGGTHVPNYLEQVAGEITIVGSIREPNLEAVFAAEPDLIIAGSNTDKAIYDKLSLIATTLVSPTDAISDWEGNLRFFGDALNKAPEVNARLADIDERIQALKPRITDNLTISIVRWNPQGPIVMSSQLFAGQLLQRLGIKAPTIATTLGKRPHSDTLSLENLAQVDADWLFLATLNVDGQAALQSAQQQPAFQRLKAVEQQQVTTVDGQIWSSGYGLIAAESVLNTIEKTLAE